jgi:outer membrane protein
MTRLWGWWATVFVIFLLLAMPAAAAGAKEAPLKIGIIDVQKIMRESKAARNAQDVFRKDLEAKRTVLMAKEKEARAIENALKGNDPKLTPAVRKEKGEKLAQEVKELKRLGADLEEDLKKKDAELTQKLIGEILQVVKALQKSENMSLILEKRAVVVADEAIDITDKVIKLYDGQKK